MSRRSLAASHDTRCAILEVAERLFRQIGYAKTTVADIAQSLGMSSANIYRFFPSKSAINNDICDRMLAQIHALMQRAASAPGTAAERLERLILACYEGHRTLLTDQKRVFDMVDAAMTEHWDAIRAHIEYCTGAVGAVIADGIAAGEFSPGDPPALGNAVMDACCTLFHPTLIAKCADDPDQPLRARQLIWLLTAALQNPNRSPMPCA